MNKLFLFFNTIRYVKFTQFYYQIFYRIRPKLFKRSYSDGSPKVQVLKLDEGICNPSSYLGNRRFKFLNLEKHFGRLDWNYIEYGKLWVYNLNYFEFLHQEFITKEEGLTLIRDFVSVHSMSLDGLDPYPISLRGINWIKFISKYEVDCEEINSCLYRDYQRLTDNLEYHLLGNHLLENAFSLLFGAYFFKEDRMYGIAKRLLKKELNEQILEDGGHFELSPMYHQIILHRVLDCYNLVKNNSWKKQELLEILEISARRMLSWVINISFKSGGIPKLNDASDGIAPTTNQLINYALRMRLKEDFVPLGDSGYRKFIFGKFEVVMDVGDIGPTYQPGHAHADNLNFVLHFNDRPIIVDTGVSTYEKNKRRKVERSTCSHNTVIIMGSNSSEVWGGFRVARRAKTFLEKDTEEELVASHNGYRRFNVIHRRYFRKKLETFIVEDEIVGNIKRGQGLLHFHPDVKVVQVSTGVVLNDEIEIEILGFTSLQLQDYHFANGFNQLKLGKKLIYKFNSRVKITFKDYLYNLN